MLSTSTLLILFVFIFKAGICQEGTGTIGQPNNSGTVRLTAKIKSVNSPPPDSDDIKTPCSSMDPILSDSTENCVSWGLEFILDPHYHIHNGNKVYANSYRSYELVVTMEDMFGSALELRRGDCTLSGKYISSFSLPSNSLSWFDHCFIFSSPNSGRDINAQVILYGLRASSNGTIIRDFILGGPKYTIPGVISNYRVSSSLIVEASFYPNPVLEKGFIQLPIQGLLDTELSISDVYGNKLQSIQLMKSESNPQLIEIDFSSYPSGIYFCQLSYTGYSKTFKVIKK